MINKHLKAAELLTGNKFTMLKTYINDEGIVNIKSVILKNYSEFMTLDATGTIREFDFLLESLDEAECRLFKHFLRLDLKNNNYAF